VGPTTPVAVAIMAKAPHAGQVKTRLCPPLSPDEAAALYRCFLLDKIEQVRMLERVSPVVAFTPKDSREIFGTLAPDFSLLPQRGPDLGDRLAEILERLLASGHQGAVAIDSDTPTLPVTLLQQAVDLLAAPGADVVLGPTEDGGYYLIGLRAPQPELFVEMPWSTPDVLPETRNRARRRGLRLVQLQPWYDVDTPEDLDRLRAELARFNEPGAPHTRRFFQALGPEPCRREAREP
jgi:rSAM/selenodomain-associated transferase 1